MTFRFALVATTIVASAPAAFAATVTNDRLANFLVTNQSLFGSGDASSFGESTSVGNSTSTFQFGASTGASSGSVNSNATVGLGFTFEEQLTTDAAKNTGVKLSFGSAAASFDTSLGAFADVGGTIRTKAGSVTLPVPVLADIVIPVAATSTPISLIDEDYQLNASDTDNGYAFGEVLTGSDAVALTGASTPSVPIVNPSASATLNINQSSDLSLTNLTGTLKATNADTGTMMLDSFLFSGGDLNFDLDLSEAGTWNLKAVDLALGSKFESDFGMTATFVAGVAVEVQDPLGVFKTGCGNPSTDADNGILCSVDEGLSTTVPNPPLNLLSINPFLLAYNEIDSIVVGQIVVSQAPPAVPLPAGFALMLVGLGAFGVMGASRQSRQA